MSKSPVKPKALSLEESLAKHAERTARSKFNKCRAPSCRKPVDPEYTVNGYCLACVAKAKARKAEQVRQQRLAQEEQHFYDNDEAFGAF